MPPANSHHFPAKVSHKTMGLITFLTFSVVIGELIVGYLANSLAVISDAAHNFADAIAVASSWYSMWIAESPVTAKRTFGFHRTGIIATFVNALILIVMALIICYEAYHRYLNPVAVEGMVVIIVAFCAASVNLFNGMLLHKASKEDINIRSAFLHIIGDVATAFGVVVAGIFIMLTDISIIDPIVSFIVGVFILWSSIGLLKDSVAVLMEGTPSNINIEELEQAINSTPGVVRCYDLHVWVITSGFIACSFHLVTDKHTLKDSQTVLRSLEQELATKFNITHTTIQIET
ncbi:CzcD superfamily cation transporter [Candidatus Trichorickettsia mobilis]|jgi:cobalt-zinc-cadmium efflux system protein|uniref:CzcD superfamily cation transporter n=1 Tax=Candidatus Trichorickettsia mobilis TaxID=1346319 RepID=A0ABZ0UWD7_9RICK|nr:cation diffusion facilitator family transporter [Candidatus Trichorickettsia mobilis]WPY01313.1 CzcD superfamily cation transporter [Candidatus Trichorickettsia mobilis]